ncbi:MAG: response regulator [Cyanobacteria bacterium CRU_2_1]|nr:response regulator [Cyanobacteria bacterium RU_5_0]NJR61290.1 response regulator [Cyanobacteria bacterium CRU_2_1]
MTPTTPTLRVLVVDDNRGDRTLIIRELHREFSQLHVREILNTRDMAEAIATGEFDVVITDYQLHWTNGLNVLREIKQHYPGCPVIMFTNTGNEEIAVEAMKAGLDDYVLKTPGRYVRLAASVRVALERAVIQHRLAQLEIRLQDLLEALNVGVFRLNAAGELLECNSTFLSLIGADSFAQVQDIQGLDWQIYSQLTDLPPPQKQEQEILLRRANDTQIWVLLSVTLKRLNGEPVVDGLLENITARKQAEIELQHFNATLEERVQERTAQLETANQNLEAFAYSISHDLQEPLRAILGFSQILVESQGDLSDPDNQLFLQRILIVSQQAIQLVQDLLSYSQLSRTELSLQPISLSLVVADVLSRLEPELRSRQAQVQVEEPLGVVIGNRTVLVQVITNLLTNAIKFVAPGVQPQVRVWAEEIVEDMETSRHENNEEMIAASSSLYLPLAVSSKRIRLWVVDNGIGIPPEDHQRIFSVFVRLHGIEVYPGTGIGLAIVHKGIERIGGTVGVESQPGQGSRFWIELIKATNGIAPV